MKWEFPGGKIEPNETEEQCLHRKLKEELGVEIEILEELESKPFHYEKFSIEGQADEVKEKGNQHPVTFLKDGKEEKMHIEANPQFKQKIFQGIEKKEVKQEPDKSKEKKETQKQDVDEEGEPKKAKKTSKGRRVGV